jgi:glycosyltransferase involved in cell wall biosynthesis
LIPLTAIVLTQDEAGNIAKCLHAIASIDDVVVVDSGSTDDTLALARAARPEARIFHHPFLDFGDQRNWALDNCQPRHEWILFVDADETCDPELLAEIEGFIRDPGSFVGGYVAGRNYFLGRWLKHTTFFPSYQLRLLKQGEVRFRKMGHGQAEVTDGPLRYLRHGWRHEGLSKGVAQWIDRHNRYSSAEREHRRALASEPLAIGEAFSSDAVVRRRALKRLAARLPGRPLWRFLYAYVWRRGFLDGYPGFLYCLLYLAHDIHIAVKTAEAAYREQGDERRD